MGAGKTFSNDAMFMNTLPRPCVFARKVIRVDERNVLR
jgi:hypothetical protein